MVPALIVLVCLLLLLFAIFLFVTKGRKHHKGLSALRNHVYAHRGLHGQDVPENSLEAFRLAKEAGFGVELDVHLLKDGNLAVFHDCDLKRMTGKEGRIVDLTTDKLGEYHLNNTNQTIPEFKKVLELFDGKVPLIVELKEVGNCASLCKAVCDMLDEYQGVYCLESFDPRCVHWLCKNRPDLIRGQLTENYFKSKSVKIPWYVKFALRHQLMNFLTKPDFVAYRFDDRKTPSNLLCRKVWKMQGVTWTIKSQNDLDLAKKENWIPIFEGFIPQ